MGISYEKILQVGEDYPPFSKIKSYDADKYVQNLDLFAQTCKGWVCLYLKMKLTIAFGDYYIFKPENK